MYLTAETNTQTHALAHAHYATHQLTNAKAEGDAAKEESERLKEQVSAFEVRMHSLSNENATFRQQVHELGEYLQQTELKVRETELRGEMEREDIHRLIEDLQACKEQAEADLLQAKQRFVQEIEAEKMRMEEYHDRLRAENEKLACEMAQNQLTLDHKVAQLQQRIQELQVHNEETSTELKQAQRKHRETSQTLAEVRHHAEHLTKDLRQTHQHLDAARLEAAKSGEYALVVEALEAEVRAKSIESKLREDESRTLRGEVSELKVEAEHLRVVVMQKDALIDKMKNEFDRQKSVWDDEFLSLSRSLEVQKSTVKERDAEVAQLTDSVLRLEHDIELLHREMKEVMGPLSSVCVFMCVCSSFAAVFLIALCMWVGRKGRPWLCMYCALVAALFCVVRANGRQKRKERGALSLGQALVQDLEPNVTCSCVNIC